MAGRYKQPVQYGRESAHKSRALGSIPHLESTCTRFNTSARRRTRPSAGPERSQQLQIPPSLNSKTILQRVRLLFLLRQHFCRRQGFWMRQVFSIRKSFWMRQVFSICQRFWMRQVFSIRQRFCRRQCFCIFCSAYIFVYFSAFLFSMRQ
jgi:hypothetical protein